MSYKEIGWKSFDDYKEELKPCPCCGNKDINISHRFENLNPAKVKCWCDKCGIETGWFDFLGGSEKMVATWNRREKKK